MLSFCVPVQKHCHFLRQKKNKDLILSSFCVPVSFTTLFLYVTETQKIISHFHFLIKIILKKKMFTETMSSSNSVSDNGEEIFHPKILEVNDNDKESTGDVFFLLEDNHPKQSLVKFDF